MSTTIENAIKAAQTADLLLQDLQALSASGSVIVHLLVLPEIRKAREMKDRLSAIAAAFVS
jgi:Tfp pilus assembly pilus retraction ATPase PilT